MSDNELISSAARLRSIYEDLRVRFNHLTPVSSAPASSDNHKEVDVILPSTNAALRPISAPTNHISASVSLSSRPQSTRKARAPIPAEAKLSKALRVTSSATKTKLVAFHEAPMEPLIRPILDSTPASSRKMTKSITATSSSASVAAYDRCCNETPTSSSVTIASSKAGIKPVLSVPNSGFGTTLQSVKTQSAFITSTALRQPTESAAAPSLLLLGTVYDGSSTATANSGAGKLGTPGLQKIKTTLFASSQLSAKPADVATSACSFASTTARRAVDKTMISTIMSSDVIKDNKDWDCRAKTHAASGRVTTADALVAPTTTQIPDANTSGAGGSSETIFKTSQFYPFANPSFKVRRPHYSANSSRNSLPFPSQDTTPPKRSSSNGASSSFGSLSSEEHIAESAGSILYGNNMNGVSPAAALRLKVTQPTLSVPSHKSMTSPKTSRIAANHAQAVSVVFGCEAAENAEGMVVPPAVSQQQPRRQLSPKRPATNPFVKLIKKDISIGVVAPN